jgi:hypothetical protein
MERQTLQQQVPVYHVCQACGGAGCSACSDLCILEGEINNDELGPDFLDIDLADWVDESGAFPYERQSPKDAVIAVTSDDVFSTEARLASVAKLMASMPYRATNAGLNRDVLCDGADSAPKADPVCAKCGKSCFDSAYGCLAPQVHSRAAGDWVCGKKSTKPASKPDLCFDDRNMYQRREDDLRLSGEWEV